MSGTRPMFQGAPAFKDAFVNRNMLTIHSDGRLSLVRAGVHASSAVTNALATAFKFPSLSMKAFANMATSGSGGSSATKWRASFCATCCAVAV